MNIDRRARWSSLGRAARVYATKTRGGVWREAETSASAKVCTV